MLRRLEALLCVAEVKCLHSTGNGDVIEPERDDLMAIGSGGHFAQSAALALYLITYRFIRREIVEKSLTIAADICVYTNII